jgi:hypothetical protein
MLECIVLFQFVNETIGEYIHYYGGHIDVFQSLFGSDR